jgi:RNA polymerase sigma-70 factor (ECF subfamily)
MAEAQIAVGRADLAAGRRRRTLYPGMLNQDQAGPAALSDLLGGAAAREQRAFAELYAASSARLFGVILRILRDREQAAEVLQDAYLTIWQCAGDYQADKGTPMAWMVAIARNRALDLRRHRRPELTLDCLEELADADANLMDLFEDAAGGRALRHCLDELDRRQRQSVLLAFAEGYTQVELAALLACPLGTAKSLVRRGLLKLKECLGR